MLDRCPAPESGAPSPIAAANDAFRRAAGHAAGLPGRLVITAGVHARGDDFAYAALKAVCAFETFDADNDPYGEHDFGAIEVEGEKLFWKIDYYADADCDAGAEDPAAGAFPVLTVMLADEY